MKLTNISARRRREGSIGRASQLEDHKALKVVEVNFINSERQYILLIN